MNHYFVPIHLRNQDFSADGSALQLDKAKKTRIYQEALKAGLPAGTVCVYLLSPTLRPLDTAPLNKPDATNPQRLAEKLQRVIRERNVVKGHPVAPPKPYLAPRTEQKDGAMFHLTARYLQRAGEEFVPLNSSSILGSQKAGNWGDLPSEAWIELSGADCDQLLPTAEVRAGLSWKMNENVTGKLLRHFFPPTENTDVEKNQLHQQSLQAHVVSIENGVARVVMEGRLKMKHSFYHQDDSNFVDAELKGYFDFETASQRLRSFRLITDHAKYGGQHFGVAVHLVTRP